MWKVVLLALVCLHVSGQSYYYPDTWYGTGSYTRADLIDAATIYDIQRCNELMPETFSMVFVSGQYLPYGPYYTYYSQTYRLSIGQTEFETDISVYATPRLDDQIQLTNGVTVDASIYILFDGSSAFLTHFFFDTSSFRSTDPTSSNFVEKQVCQVVYGQDPLPVDKSTNSAPRTKVAGNFERGAECDFLSTPGAYVTFDTGLACLNAVPFSTTTRDEIVSAAQNMLAFYVYQDTNCDVSYGSEKISLDIIAEVNNIGTKSYDSDFLLHRELYNTFVQMRDAHTTWAYPQCYQNWFLFQPFALSSYAEQNGNQVITISGNFQAAVYLAELDLDVSAYIGYIVTEIDGVDAVSYLTNWADTYLVYKDQATRFNFVLNLFSNRLAVRYELPSNPTLTWTLRHPSTQETITLSFDWLILPPALDISSTAEFIDYCTSVDKQSVCSTTVTGSANLGDFSEVDNTFFDAQIPEAVPEYRSKSADVTTAAYALYSLAQVNSEVGVLVIPNFASAFGIQHTVTSFSVLYLTAIHTYNFDRLIVDVSTNGGGFIYTGYFLAGLVLPSIKDTTKIYNYDVIHNDLMDFAMDYVYNSGNTTLLNNVLADPGNLFVRAQAGQTVLDTTGNWYFKGKSYKRGGKTSTYSKLYELSQQDDARYTSQLTDIHNSVEYETFPIQDIEILSNGVCFSTCSLFVRALIEFGGSNKGPQLVGWGGLIGEPLGFSDIPANVLDVQFLSFFFGRYGWIPGYPLDLVPRTFPFVSALDCLGRSFQIAYAEAYNDKDDPATILPLEFRTDPAQCRLNVWKTGPELYAQAAYAFYYCPNSDFQNNQVSGDSNGDSSDANILVSSVALLFLVFMF